MKKLLCCVLGTVMVVTADVASFSQSSGRADSGPVKERLLGAWKLAWIEEQGADGKMTRIVDRRGTIVYTRDGHMSVQIMLPKPEDSPGGNPIRYDQGGYEAYYGTFRVNEQAHTVTHHVEGALVRKLVGNDLTRVYQFSGGQLILKSYRGDEHWTIAWEHY